MPLTCSIIIPAYNAEGTLEACLRALEEQTVPREAYEVLVVDDGSTDRTGEVAKWFPVVFLSQPNRGPASARNLGIAHAQGEILLFTDADCIPTKNWIEEMLAPLEDKEVAGVKGIYRTDQQELVARFAQVEYEEKYLKMAKFSSIDFVDTYSAGYQKAILQEVGGFDPVFPAATGEDADLSFRIAAKGYRLVFNPKAIVFHRHPETVWRYGKRKFKQPYWRLKVIRRHPRKFLQDSHTPQTQKVQTVLMVFLLAEALGLGWSSAFLLPLLWTAGLFCLTMTPFLLKAWRRDRVVAIWSPALLLFRAFAFALGLLAGLGAWALRSLGRGRGYQLIKRFMDLFIASVGLVLCLPLFAILALLIKLDSPGPVFFFPKRVGRGGRVFTLLKFRSMSVDAEEVFSRIAHLNEEPTGLIIKIPNDPRVTRIGRFLRKSSLDEIPQFLNVLKGEMSIVGPRPPSPKEVEQYNARQRRRLEVLPGLTGLWQVSGRKDTDFDSMVEKDIEYIDNRSLWLDVKIILKTIPCLLLGKGAR